MNQEIGISWKDGLAFEAVVNGHLFVLDAECSRVSEFQTMNVLNFNSNIERNIY